MAKQSAARMVFFAVLMTLALSVLARPHLQNKVESHLLLQELGYNEKKLEHSQHVFASTINTDRNVPGGPNPIHNPGSPPKHSQHVFAPTMDTDRNVPGGPNPIHNPGSPPKHYQHVFAPTMDTDRNVPGGPNPIHNPSSPPKMY
ncbi:hypothetical protein SLA2020_224430 [Shorea laevis]